MRTALLRSARTATALGVAALLGMTAACADSPTAPAGPSASDAPLANRSGASAQQQKSVLRLSQAEFDLLRVNWGQFQKALESGSHKAEALRCEPTRPETGTKRIGAKGGRLVVGQVILDVPAGALAGDVTITGSTRPGPFLEIQFAPHGLKFAKPVQLTFNYARCNAAAGVALDVVYVGNGWRILETVPTTDKRSAKQIHALTDHFSGYMVSMGRKDSSLDD